MSDVEQEVKRIEEGEAWEETDEVVKVQVKRPLDKVIPVRLPSDTWEELRREATIWASGLPPWRECGSWRSCAR